VTSGAIGISAPLEPAGEPYGGVHDAAWREVDWSRHERTRVVAGRRLRFVDVGHGDAAVLLLHGHGSTWQYWLEVLALLSSGDRRVIAVDLPGFGASQAYSFATTSMDAVVGALRELLDQLQVTRCDVIGHSFGTIVGIELAVADPQRVSTLTVAGGPALSIVAMFKSPLRTSIRLPRLAVTVLGDMCTAGLPIPRWVQRLVAGRRWLRRLGFGSYVARPAELAPDLAEQLMAGVGAPGYFHLPLKARRFTPVAASELRCPVLVVNGDHDAFVPRADVAAFLRDVPYARSHTIIGAGHLVTVEYPATFVRLFTEFRNSLTSPAHATA